MDMIKHRMDELNADLITLLKNTEQELQLMPPGNLRCYTRKGKKIFQHAISSDEGMLLKGINRDQKLIAQLARKEFLQQLHDTAEWDTRLLQHLLKEYKTLDPEGIAGNMSRAARRVPDRTFLSSGKLLQDAFSDEERAARMEEHRKWAMEDFEQNDYKPEEKIHLTSSGEYVRSKSEALISEKLFDRNVPNRYEQIIRLDGKRYSPDFTFRDASGNWFFWEHAGRMNETAYIRRHLKKMSVYERCGIVPWENLIVTYDTVDGGINVAFIDSIIRFQILPRL